MRHMLGGECSAVDATAEWVPDPSALDCPRCLELQAGLTLPAPKGFRGSGDEPGVPTEWRDCGWLYPSRRFHGADLCRWTDDSEWWNGPGAKCDPVPPQAHEVCDGPFEHPVLRWSFSVEEPVLSMPIVRWPSSLPRPVAEVVRELHPGTHVDTDRELLRKALLALTPDAGETVYRWSLVRSALGHGSTIGNAICIAVGIDPDELVESPMPVWWKETEGEE